MSYAMVAARCRVAVHASSWGKPWVSVPDI